MRHACTRIPREIGSGLNSSKLLIQQSYQPQVGRLAVVGKSHLPTCRRQAAVANWQAAVANLAAMMALTH